MYRRRRGRADTSGVRRRVQGLAAAAAVAPRSRRCRRRGGGAVFRQEVSVHVHVQNRSIFKLRVRVHRATGVRPRLWVPRVVRVLLRANAGAADAETAAADAEADATAARVRPRKQQKKKKTVRRLIDARIKALSGHIMHTGDLLIRRRLAKTERF